MEAAATSSKESLLQLLKTQVVNCRRCPLGFQRIQAVFGAGNPKSPVVFIGEAPGYEEDRQGKPFVGRAGELLNQIIEENLHQKRGEVYISNVVKCHPMINPKNKDSRGNDRPPTLEELKSCLPWWQAELEIIKPKAVCLLGASALSAFLGEKSSVGEYRGKTIKDRRFLKIAIFVTYHPAAILRNIKLMDTYKEDFQKLSALL